MLRYGIIREKDPREIVLLRGKGCFYKKCTFCDYHLDACSDDDANVALNRDVLKQVTGEYGNLEVINSGSFHELGEKTLSLIRETVREKGIKVLHFEAHYLVRNKIAALREFFPGVEVRLRVGLESFNEDLREGYLKKGMPGVTPEEVARYFQEANFMVGLKGQTLEMMKKDVELGLRYFRRITLNVMCDNTTPIKPDQGVIDVFMREIYPKYKDDVRVDILIHNTDFTVGTPE
ncbi:radical SAM protein [bacterium]|nr:radical SAM protein [bacterium]